MKVSKKILALLIAVLLAFGSLTVAFAAGEIVGEVESNNTTKTATPITDITAGAKGVLSDATDIDIYSFELQENGYYNLVFTQEGHGDSSVYFLVKLYKVNDETNNPDRILTMDVYGDKQTTTSPNTIALAKGKYLIRVEAGTSSAAYTYSIKATKVSMPYKTETENNDTPDTASTLTPNYTDYAGNLLLYGTLSATDKIDYYSFTLTDDGYISLNMKNGKAFGTVNSEFLFVISQYSNSVSPVLNKICTLKLSVDKDGVKGPDIGLGKGTYYIAVTGNGSYGIEVLATKDSSSEKEFNNNKDNANDLVNGKEIFASLTNSSDTDYFKVVTTTEASSTIKVAALSAEKFDGELSVIIYKSLDGKLNEVDSGKVTGTTPYEYDLGKQAAGTFYIRVATGSETPTKLYVISAKKSEAGKVAPDGAGFFETIKFFIKNMDWSQFDTYKELIKNIGLGGMGTVIGYFTKSFVPVMKKLIEWIQMKG